MISKSRGREVEEIGEGAVVAICFVVGVIIGEKGVAMGGVSV